MKQRPAMTPAVRANGQISPAWPAPVVIIDECAVLAGTRRDWAKRADVHDARPVGQLEKPMITLDRQQNSDAYAALPLSGWAASHSSNVGPASLACGPGSSEPSAAASLSGSALFTSSIRTWSPRRAVTSRARLARFSSSGPASSGIGAPADSAARAAANSAWGLVAITARASATVRAAWRVQQQLIA